MESLTIKQLVKFHKQNPCSYLPELSLFLQTCDLDFTEGNYQATTFSGVTKIRESKCHEYYRPFRDYLQNTITPLFDFDSMFAESNTTINAGPPIIPHINSPSVIIEKTKKYIDVDINNFQDLLQIIRDNEYDANCEYNIDLQSLHKIKDELEDLDKMIGLKQMKDELLNQLLYFSQNLHCGKNHDFMHTILSGPPGTGKTEIAIMIGKMYSKLGILKKNIFRKVTRNDLVAGYLGQTALKTKKVIDECLGGCLFIDEAYSLANDFSGDSYSRECIDVLCESLSAHKDELMVIIAGYEDQLNKTFFQANQGLKSRFIWKFHLQKYNAIELAHIFIKNVADANWSIEINDSDVEKWMERNHKTFEYYGRDMELLLSYSKISHARRIFGKPSEIAKQLTISDLNHGYEKFQQNASRNKDVIYMGMYS
jgi:SpoVK/Ycf46/Vps4 family AAA+-type ATPase